MKISVLMSHKHVRQNAHAAYPIRAFAKPLRALGLEVSVSRNPASASVRKSDVVVVVDGGFKHLFPLRERISPLRDRVYESEQELLDNLSQGGRKIIWYDNADHSGGIRTHLLPRVDLYMKMQLLKDRRLYARPSRLGVLFRDYYRDLYDIADQSDTWRGPLSEEDLSKLVIGWNLGLGNWRLPGSRRMVRRMAVYRPLLGHAKANYCSTRLRDRPLDVTFRGALWSEKPTVHYQRKKTDDLLAGLAQGGDWRIARGGAIGFQEYTEELRQSKVVVSPFGNGEICYRDFECFLAGAVLFKPDMGHFETFPDYFEPHVTYVPHRWDFSDFEEKLIDILEHPERYESIARAGQQRFRDSLSPAGGARFADHFADIMQRICPVSRRALARGSETLAP